MSGLKSLIRDETQVKQAIDYTGCQKGKLYFTDVDAKMEVDDRFFIAVEVKRVGVEIGYGQGTLLERDAINTLKAGMYDIMEYKKSVENTRLGPLPNKIKRLKKKAVVIKAVYELDDDVELIPLHNCRVTKHFIQKENSDTEMEWVDVPEEPTVLEYLDNIIDEWGIDRMKIK